MDGGRTPVDIDLQHVLPHGFHMDETLAETPRDVMREDPSLITLKQEEELREAAESLSDDVTFEILLHGQSSMIHCELRRWHLHLLVTGILKLTPKSPFEVLVAPPNVYR